MAEVLGLTASIVAVLQITQSVLSVCYDYSAALKGASWELTKAKDELEGLRSVLQALEPLMREAEATDPADNTKLPTLEALCRPRGVLQACVAEMQQLEKKLKGPGWSKHLGPRRKAFLQSLRWPLQEDETRKALERIARFRDTLGFALDVDVTRLTLAIHSLELETNETVLETNENVLGIKNTMLDVRDQADRAKLENDRKAIKECKASSQPDKLTEALVEIIRDLRETFIVIDALDESGKREDSFKIVEKIRGYASTGTHMLLTSRNIPDIEECLSPLTDPSNRVRLGSASVDPDILAYIDRRLQNDRGLRRWKSSPGVQDEIRTTLMEKADGMFRWTVCQLDALQNCSRLPSLRKALKNLPKSLDETYCRILCNIPEEGVFGTALQAAPSRDNQKIVELLLEKGANVNARVGTQSPALQAVFTGRGQEIVEFLLRGGADVDVRGGIFCTALGAAVIGNEVAVVQLLLKEGAVFTAQDFESIRMTMLDYPGDCTKVMEILHEAQSRNGASNSSTTDKT
ncbi:MAG: hypothetical protein Q9213_006266 [Squamulea squamosa]